MWSCGRVVVWSCGPDDIFIAWFSHPLGSPLRTDAVLVAGAPLALVLVRSEEVDSMLPHGVHELVVAGTKPL